MPENRYSDVRRLLKATYTGEIMEAMTDPKLLAQRYPRQSHPELWAGDELIVQSASHKRLLEIVNKMAPSDKGNWAEKWYHKTFASDAAVHVEVKKDVLNAGLDNNLINKDRSLDLLSPDGTLIEIKTVKKALEDRDIAQFNDFMELTSKKVRLPVKGGNSIKVE